jgi:membrane-associated protein
MSYSKFLAYNVIGGIVWVLVCTQAGWWLGKNAFVQSHFEIVVIIIVAISLLPAVWEFAMVRYLKKEEAAPPSPLQPPEANLLPGSRDQ